MPSDARQALLSSQSLPGAWATPSAYAKILLENISESKVDDDDFLAILWYTAPIKFQFQR